MKTIREVLVKLKFEMDDEVNGDEIDSGDVILGVFTNIKLCKDHHEFEKEYLVSMEVKWQDAEKHEGGSTIINGLN
jgi:hypothetical protein